MKKILLFFACLLLSGQVFAIDAKDDAYAIAAGGISFADPVTDNDIFIGNITITQISSTHRGITLNGGGNISIMSNVPPGVYTLVYEICDSALPPNCDTATVTIIIGMGVGINAVNDTYCMAKSTGTITLSPTILLNDTRDSLTANTVNTDMTLLTSIPGISLSSSTGAILVQSSVVPGVYVLQYELCHSAYPALCDIATITITVGNPMTAVDDEALISYDPGTQTIIDILDNDIYNGGSATTSNVDVTLLSSLPTGLSYNSSTGVLTSTGLAPGTYNIEYQICDVATPCSCKTASITIIVTTDNDELSPSDIRANNTVRVSGVQSDNKIIIAGDFTTYGGAGFPANKIARLNHSDLTQDTSFNDAGTADAASSYVDVIKDFKVLPNDYIIVVGKWAGFSGSMNERNIALLDPIGTNTGWSGGIGTTPDTFINAVEVIPEVGGSWDFVIAGTFSNYDMTGILGLARIDGNTGTIVSGFNTYTPGVGGFGGGEPLCTANYNGKIIIGGNFTSYRNQPVGGIVMVNANTGLIEPGFDVTGVPAGSSIHDIVVNGSDIYVGGSFNSYDGNPTKKNIVKLNPNGTIIPGFVAQFNGTVRALSFQQTPSSFVSNIGASNLYVGGDFTTHTYSGTTTSTPKIAALNPSSGNKNPLFNPGGGPNNSVYTLAIENSGVKLILGGSFTQYNSTQAQRLTRVFPGGLGAGQQGRLNMFDNTDANVSIYPNPSEGLFTINFEGYDEQRFNVTVHNVLGQLIYSGEVTTQTPAQLDLSSANAGNYFVTLQNSTETINKIIIKK